MYMSIGMCNLALKVSYGLDYHADIVNIESEQFLKDPIFERICSNVGLIPPNVHAVNSRAIDSRIDLGGDSVSRITQKDLGDASRRAKILCKPKKLSRIISGYLVYGTAQ